jgi:hypothetical protein
VTVRIIVQASSALFLSYAKPPDCIPHPLPQRGRVVALAGDERGLPSPSVVSGCAEPGRSVEYPDLTPGLGVAVYETLDTLSCHEAHPLSPAVGHVSFGVLFTPGDEILAVVGGEAVLQRPDRGREAVLPGVEPIGSLSVASSPGRYSPLPKSVSTHARVVAVVTSAAAVSACAHARGAATHCKNNASAARNFRVWLEILFTGA